MPVYVALLRGINLGGHKKIKMQELRASLTAMGFAEVKTYIQSGNVVFKAAKISDKALSTENREDNSFQVWSFRLGYYSDRRRDRAGDCK